MITGIVRSKRYPTFIRQHNVFKRTKSIRKVFPKIGLSNCQSPASVFKNSRGLKDYTIVFSSNGKQGLWDIATMSARGIASCQGWSGSYRHRLIGSMVDPCAGIIYIAGGKLAKGTKMLHRSVVRLVLNNRTKKPAILLEETYSSYDRYGWNGADRNTARELFKTFIRSKLGNKYPIIGYGHGHFIPETGLVKHIGEGTRSYRDSGIAYKPVKGSLKKYLVR